jgi:hypothetical protein
MSLALNQVYYTNISINKLKLNLIKSGNYLQSDQETKQRELGLELDTMS